MITAQHFADTLNGMMEVDPTATHAPIINRIPCNKALADHPYVIVDQLGHPDRTVVGIVGVINGILTEAGSTEVLAYQFDDAEDGNGTTRNALKGFRVVPRQD